MDPIARRTSRRHAQRLSTDSSVTQSSTAYTALPAYSSRHSASSSIYSDKPPEYQGQSADEADLDDSDHEHEYNARLPTSPFRKRSSNPSRRSSYNRPSSSSSAAAPDPLDSLLARSVHALELSNVLLQSTMATRSNLATSMAHDHRVDRNLELSATFLNNRIRDTSVAQAAWLNDIDGVVRDVHHLYDDGSSVSRSLPSGSGSGSPPPILSLGARVLPDRHRRSSYSQDSERPRLRLSHSPPRDSRHYMSRPPRAMTQYVSIASEHGDAGESTANSESIYMPSTIGLQSTAHLSSFRSANGPRRPDPLRLHHPNSSSPGFIQYGGASPGIEHGGAWGGSGPRRSRLSSPRSAGPSRTSITSSSPSQRSARSSSDSQRPSARDRRYGRAGLGISTAHHARSRSASDSSARGRSRTRSQTPTTHSRADSANTILHKPLMPPLRSMTPPLEESPPEEQLSSDSGPNVTRTLDALRRILDAAPSPEKPRVIPKRPSFLMPKSPTPSPEVGTSTATATVSRLFTKGTHSTRDTPPSRPSLRLPGGSPRESMSISAPSSGRSTPRQVAFAQLPEPYSAEGTRRGFDKSRSSKSKSKSGGEKDKDEPQGFWSMLFSAVTPPSGSHNPSGRMEDRVEDRMSRNWARSGGQSTLDDYLY